ncbi:hypothetical protein NXS98_02930 [Fontisphaera persica]|uniref:hypothetical protein n=1 Tax=Fontisphaera persica TaxID=2974023 RepID=UPI0024C01FD1|nr:hypothetical protein [Fontisphaera persica]WCJ60095.1 hypothetical protein NXS98_02930 [Fontisphaera persica]
MKWTLFPFTLAAVLAFLPACKEKAAAPPPATSAPIVKTGGRELVGGGVKFLIPLEESSGHSDSAVGLTYESPTLRVTLARGILYVNATNFGNVKPGDVVNLLNPGRVIVNDQDRVPLPAAGLFKEPAEKE